jgi:YD repeat-containing protein
MNRRKKTINFRFTTDNLGTPRTVSYGYDQFGFRTLTTYPDGSTTIGRTNTSNGQINTLSRGLLTGEQLPDFILAR